MTEKKYIKFNEPFERCNISLVWEKNGYEKLFWGKRNKSFLISNHSYLMFLILSGKWQIHPLCVTDRLLGVWDFMAQEPDMSILRQEYGTMLNWGKIKKESPLISKPHKFSIAVPVKYCHRELRCFPFTISTYPSWCDTNPSPFRVPF